MAALADFCARSPMNPAGLCRNQSIIQSVSALSVGQPLIGYPECFDMTMNMTTESKYQPPSGCDDSTGTVDQFLDNGLYPPALGRVANDPFTGDQTELTDEPEDIVHQGGAGHDELVGGKLARGESLQVHVGFDLGVILFTKTMAAV